VNSDQLKAVDGIKSYKELVVWQKAMLLAEGVYRLSVNMPKEERFGLISQIRRAAVSVPSNIAEGQGRLSRGEFKQFLGQARGSLYELETQVRLANSLTYLSNDSANELLFSSAGVGRLLNGLITSLR
jgi:four helix bundle protein